jgi:hypothetical protein
VPTAAPPPAAPLEADFVASTNFGAADADADAPAALADALAPGAF